jgi:hypothetical protein
MVMYFPSAITSLPLRLYTILASRVQGVAQQQVKDGLARARADRAAGDDATALSSDDAADRFGVVVGDKCDSGKVQTMSLAQVEALARQVVGLE